MQDTLGGATRHVDVQGAQGARLGEINFDWPAASNEPKQGTRATHFVRYEEVQLGKAAAQVMVLFAEKGVKEGKEITWIMVIWGLIQERHSARR